MRLFASHAQNNVFFFAAAAAANARILPNGCVSAVIGEKTKGEKKCAHTAGGMAGQTTQVRRLIGVYWKRKAEHTHKDEREIHSRLCYKQ